MYKSLFLLALIFQTALNKPKELPFWFNKAFREQNLSQKYLIVKTNSPYFLEADFNGDKKADIAVQIQDKITGKTGILLMNSGQKTGFIFGAGKNSITSVLITPGLLMAGEYIRINTLLKQLLSLMAIYLAERKSNSAILQFIFTALRTVMK